jgi:hypothetical protein
VGKVHVTPVKTAVSGFDEPTAQPAQPWDYSHGVTKAFEANRNNLSGSRGLRKFGVAIQRGASSPIKMGPQCPRRRQPGLFSLLRGMIYF